MDLLEHQAKDLFAQYGVAVPRGKVAWSPEEAEAAAAETPEPSDDAPEAEETAEVEASADAEAAAAAEEPAAEDEPAAADDESK